ncbi:MAG: right-handed parallel beta-helix repeat-containing protein [Phycisphaerales bacterium]|nr:MAG: right-handed parallel beta-helix repeat-containing protein [Phycisphaerales bacterium]
MSRRTLLSIAVFGCCGWPVTAAADVWYVDAGAPPAGDGTSWEQAFAYLQDALAAASAGDEIRVAQGIHRPDERSDWTPGGTGDRYASFHLINNVTLRGGYAGYGAADPDARDIETFETVLSGDLNEDDGPDFTNYAENSYHVVTGSGTDETAVLDGLTVSGGSADGEHWPSAYGGGVYNDAGSPTVTHCTFWRNQARRRGGGMCNYNHSHATVAGCTFIQNSAGMDQLSRGGGGVCATSSSEPTLTDCLFKANTSQSPWGASGIYISQSSHVLVHGCTFEDNEATQGAIYNEGGTATLTDCLFKGNAGGLKNEGTATLIRCDFIENVADSGTGCVRTWYAGVTLLDCVFMGNTSPYGGSALVSEAGAFWASGCDFVGNSAAPYHPVGGGAVRVSGQDPDLPPSWMVNCRFLGNAILPHDPFDAGGAIYLSGCDAALVNCLFSGNSNQGGRGGAVCAQSCSPTLIHCDVVNNRSPGHWGGGGLYCTEGGTPTIVNSIFWGNTDASGNGEAAQIYASAADPEVYTSCIQGGWSGIGSGNINKDPVFADALGPDKTAGTVDDNLQLRVASPCMDAGDTAALPADLADLDGDGDTTEPLPWDLGGGPRVADGNEDGSVIVDMGAYERSAAFCSWSDFDGNARVDLGDYAVYSACFALEAPYPPTCPEPTWTACDLNGNAVVDLADFATFAVCFGWEAP